MEIFNFEPLSNKDYRFHISKLETLLMVSPDLTLGLTKSNTVYCIPIPNIEDDYQTMLTFITNFFLHHGRWIFVYKLRNKQKKLIKKKCGMHTSTAKGYRHR